jgi:hypothetical protein
MESSNPSQGQHVWRSTLDEESFPVAALTANSSEADKKALKNWEPLSDKVENILKLDLNKTKIIDEKLNQKFAVS